MPTSADCCACNGAWEGQKLSDVHPRRLLACVAHVIMASALRGKCLQEQDVRHAKMSYHTDPLGALPLLTRYFAGHIFSSCSMFWNSRLTSAALTLLDNAIVHSPKASLGMLQRQTYTLCTVHCFNKVQGRVRNPNFPPIANGTSYSLKGNVQRRAGKQAERGADPICTAQQDNVSILVPAIVSEGAVASCRPHLLRPLPFTSCTSRLLLSKPLLHWLKLCTARKPI